MSQTSQVSNGITEHKSEEEANQDVWRRAFDLFDKNRDGTISLEELGMVLRSLNLNPTEKQVKEARNQLDKDGNGICNFLDFKILMKEMTPAQKSFEKEMMTAFKIFDQNRNNIIERKEIRHILTSFGETLTESELDIMMNFADLNGDGVIDYKEFVKMCMKPCF